MDANQSNYIAIAVTSAVAFFFGKTGILHKSIDFFIGNRKLKQQREDELLQKKDKQIEELTTLVDELKVSVAMLEKDLIKTSAYVKTLLAYLETMMPDGTNPFIKEMAKEIRNEKK